MKNLMKIYLGISLVLIVMMSCSQSKALNYGENLNRKWMLKTLQGVSNEDVVDTRAFVDLENLSKGNGYAGCNKIFFTTKTGSGKRISFTNIGATKMYCEKTMNVEMAFTKALEKVAQYELNGHQAKFKDKNGNVLMVTIAADWD